MNKRTTWLAMLLASVYGGYLYSNVNVHPVEDTGVTLMSAESNCVEGNDIHAGDKTAPSVPFLSSHSTRKNSVYPSAGRLYYNSLVDQACYRNYLLSMAFHYDFTDKAYGNDGTSLSLTSLGTSGNGVSVRDVFLIARLAGQGKLHIYTPGNVPPNPQFGNAPSEQYLNLISPASVHFTGYQSAFNVDITGMFKYDFVWCYPMSMSIGFQVPLKHKEAAFLISLDGGKLYQAGYIQQATQRETTITQFFKDFESMEDFFIRAVLRPKGINFAPVISQTGIGDSSLFGILDIAECWQHVDAWQFGVTLVMPTGSKNNPNTLFDTGLGNGGGFLIDVFSNILFKFQSDAINPYLQVGAEFGAGSYTSMQRVSQIKVQPVEGLLRNNPTLIVPIYREYRTDAFEELDSFVPFLADSAVLATIKRGYKFFVGFGNYIYNLFDTDSRLGLYYDYLQSGANKMSGLPANFVTSLSTAFTASAAHRIGWNFTCKAGSVFDISVGSQHIVAGKNVAKLNELFAVVTAVF